MLNNPYAVLMLTEQELENTPFPRGDIISTNSAISFENFPGDHVFLSLGGVGKDTAVIEFDSRTRGRTTLGDILSRHRSAPQIAGDAIIKYPAPPKSAGGYCLLYLYHPIWLDHWSLTTDRRSPPPWKNRPALSNLLLFTKKSGIIYLRQHRI